jgi:hypothetical protein
VSGKAWEREQFQRCSPWIQAALDYGLGEYELEHVWALIEDGSAQIWPTPNACMITMVDTYPTGLKVLKGWLSGGDLDEILRTIPVIEAWAKKAGCTYAAIGGRKGWLRKLPDYHEKYTVIAKAI